MTVDEIIADDIARNGPLPGPLDQARMVPAWFYALAALVMACVLGVSLVVQSYTH